jgi:hypothetical protein
LHVWDNNVVTIIDSDDNVVTIIDNADVPMYFPCYVPDIVSQHGS